MENQNETPKEQTFKALRITQPDGSTKTVPANRENKKHFAEYGTWLTKAKQEKYKVEEVELTLDEAVTEGISQAIEIKFPPKRAKAAAAANTEMMAQLLQQNAEMAQQNQQMMNIILQGMAAKEENPKTKK